MTKRISLFTCVIIALALVFTRLHYAEGEDLKVTTWDAFGYYMYVPSAVIYDDMSELNWFPEVDSTYQLSGGALYQARQQEDGTYVNKYLGGVAIMQLPSFVIGHVIAKNSHYKADGFSPPYQYAIAFGAILYVIVALFMLRGILLRYYTDLSVAMSLLLLGLATNFIQYTAIDSAQSHAYIFFLYVLVLYATIKWHEAPKAKWAALIGLTIGFAGICRPTELIMLFIPLLWGHHTKESRKEKWALVKRYRHHILFVLLFGLIGIAPQLMYWKVVTGSFVYNVGSKWYFLNPFFRVLFGFENGWFIYTPATILFVAGFFFIKKYPFQKSVIVFCLLNLWIIMAWSDWKYGATYSMRALVQSYPVFALASTALLQRWLAGKWKYVFYPIAAYLIFVNVFQIGQYNDTILHYRDMNRRYYSSIYLNPSPTPMDMSLLDTEESFADYNDASSITLHLIGDETPFTASSTAPAILLTSNGEDLNRGWLVVQGDLLNTSGFSSSYLNLHVKADSFEKHSKIRLFNPISKEGTFNPYAFAMEITEDLRHYTITVSLETTGTFEGAMRDLTLDLAE